MMPQEVIDVLTSNIDTLWVIDCAILVFIMQAGFMCMETGLSRHKNSINVALKNAADFGVYEQFQSSAPPLGVIKQKDKSIYNINKMKLNGSRFYAFTDGLSESLNDKGQEIGIDGSIDIIETNYNKDTTQQLNDITRMVVNTSKNQKLTDDLTVISIGK